MTPFRWSDREVRRALGRRDGEDEPTYGRVWTDTRSLAEGDLFVALAGERFDGHDYLHEAARAGARGAVVALDRQQAAAEAGLAAYPVEDTLVAFGQLARHRRRALPARVVGITGSSGKTTTKDLCRAAVGEQRRTWATVGNLNNRVGVPRTLLDAPGDTEVVLVEMGTNLPGEIGILTAIAEPELGVVTTVGEAHLEGLGSIEGVLHEKLALVRGLPAGATALVGDEPAALADAARRTGRRIRVAGWGPRADADLRPVGAHTEGEGGTRWTWQGQDVHLALPGRAAVTDALLALGVSRELNVDAASAVRGLARVSASGMRGEVRRLGSLRVIVDCYNANPQSVRAALELLAALPHSGARIAVLGSMLELGERSDALHRTLLDEALRGPADRVVATGAFAAAAAALPASDRLLVQADVDALAERLVAMLDGTELVLLKGSRGVRLERVLEPLTSAFGSREG